MGLQVMETGSLKRNPEKSRTLVPKPPCWDGLGGGCLGIQPGIWAKVSSAKMKSQGLIASFFSKRELGCG